MKIKHNKAGSLLCPNCLDGKLWVRGRRGYTDVPMFAAEWTDGKWSIEYPAPDCKRGIINALIGGVDAHWVGKTYCQNRDFEIDFDDMELEM